METEVISRIGRKIKALRQERNLTLQELSAKSNISKGLLSKIENSRTVPSLPVILTLIQSLDISLKDFFEDMTLVNGSNYIHIKKGAYKAYEKENREGFLYHYILAHNFSNINIEIAILEIEKETESNPTTTDGFEFKYILVGEIEYHLDNEVILLQEGDSFFFDASKPHLPVNKSGKPAKMLVIYFIVP